MPTGVITLYSTVGGNSLASSMSRTGGGQFYHEIGMPAGSTCAITWSSTHLSLTGFTGFTGTTGTRVGIFWGSTAYHVGLTAVTVSATTVGLTNVNGTGTTLPTTSNVTGATFGCETTAPATKFDGDDMVLWTATADQKCACNFLEVTGTTSVGNICIQNAGDGNIWASDIGYAVPITGDEVSNALAYNGSTVAATLKFGGILTT